MDSAETNTTAGMPAVPMSGLWPTIRGYILWSYERGTIQYDVMVTLILLFVFLSPNIVNFKDRPVEHNPHSTEVVVVADGQGGLIYQVEGSAITAQDANDVRSELQRIIEPISGAVSITKVEPLRDHSGRVLRYKVWVEKE